MDVDVCTLMMVARQRSPTVKISQLQMNETNTMEEIEGMTTLDDQVTKGIEMVPWKSSHDMRPKTLAALASSKTLRPQHPLFKMRYRTMTSAAKSLDILRQNLQAAINKEIDLVIKKYLEKFFTPAVRNVRENLGHGSVTEELIREVCRAMLEEAKQMYCSVTVHKSTSPPSEPEFIAPDAPLRKRKATDADVVQKKRAYPPYVKWDPSRVDKNTHFILSTTANKILGLSSMKNRLTEKHPDLVRYMVDQDDREWLSTAGVTGQIQPNPPTALLLLEDIIQLANFDEYRQNALLYVSELKGFCLPDFIQRKVRAYMTLMRTKYIEPDTMEPLPAPVPEPPPPAPVLRIEAPRIAADGPRITTETVRISPEALKLTSDVVRIAPDTQVCDDTDNSLAFDEAYLLSDGTDFDDLSSSFGEVTELSCIDPSILPSYIRIQQPIQMSVGVECLSPTTLSAIDTGGLIEFDTSLLALRSEEDD